ncbi:MAG: VanZ family protein [Clostridiales bacterium]|nr:VanZ family protein [Clostridiales bacterium]
MKGKKAHTIKQNETPNRMGYLKLGIGLFFSILSLSLIVYTMIKTIFNKVYYQMGNIIFTFFMITVFCFIGCLLLCSSVPDSKHKYKIKRYSISLIFIYYCFLLVNLLFLNRSYRYISPTLQGLGERLRCNSNLVPFRTINNYLFNLEHDELRIRVTNLLGNLLAFMPMAFFLPTYSKKLRKALPFGLCMFFLILTVEVVQGITCVGYLDIDDLILNLTGATIAFLICKFKFIQSMEKRIMN